MRLAFSMLLCLVAPLLVAMDGRALGTAGSSGRAAVSEVVLSQSADLIVLSAGYNHGFRPGSVCLVTRESKPLATIVIAEATEQRAVALILSLENQQTIAAGDAVALRANPRI
jgi:hypothetical protein